MPLLDNCGLDIALWHKSRLPRDDFLGTSSCAKNMKTSMGGQEKKGSAVLFQACVVFLLAKQCDKAAYPSLRKEGMESKRKMLRR